MRSGLHFTVWQVHVNRPRDCLFFLTTFDHGFIGPVVNVHHRVQTFGSHFDLSHAAWKSCVAFLFRRRKALPPASGPWPVLLLPTPRYTRVFPFKRNWLLSGLDFVVRQVHVDRPRDRFFFFAFYYCWIIGPVVNIYHRVQTFGGHFDFSHAVWKSCVAGLFRRRKTFPPADGPWPVLLLVTARYTRVFPFERNWLLSGLHFAVRQVHVDRPRDCLFFLATFDHGFIGPVVNIYHRVQTFGGHFDFSHAAWKSCVAFLFRRRKALPPASGPWPVLLLPTPRYTRVFPFKRNWLLSGLDFVVRQVHVDRPRDRFFFFAFYYCWIIGPVVNIYHRVQTFGGHFDFSHAVWKSCVAGLFRRRKTFPPADGPWPVLLLVTARYTRVFPFERNWLLSGLHFAVRQVHVDRPRDCLFFLATFDHGFIGPVVNIYHRVQTFGGHFDFSHVAWKGCVAGLFRRRKTFPPADGP